MPAESRARLGGAVMVMVAAMAFSGKAVTIKLAYRHQVDPVTLLALRMLMSAPFFLALGWWATRGAGVQPLSRSDLRNVALLGLVGYYLASYFDFLGLEHVTAALERLLLFIHPTFVLLLAAAFFNGPSPRGTWSRSCCRAWAWWRITLSRRTRPRSCRRRRRFTGLRS